jgi:hypothetical protein
MRIKALNLEKQQKITFSHSVKAVWYDDDENEIIKSKLERVNIKSSAFSCHKIA